MLSHVQFIEESLFMYLCIVLKYINYGLIVTIALNDATSLQNVSSVTEPSTQKIYFRKYYQ